MGNDDQMSNHSASGTATNEERSVEVYNFIKTILYIHIFLLVTSNNFINIKAQQIRQSQGLGHFFAPYLVTGQIVNYFTLWPDNYIIYYNSSINILLLTSILTKSLWDSP